MNYITDATTVVLFRERSRTENVIDEPFDMFGSYLREQGKLSRGGQIIYAKLVPVLKGRNNRKGNKEIKANRIPDGWN